MHRDGAFHGRKSRHGAAFLMALLVSIVLAILVSALLSMRVTELRAISGTVRTTHAQLIAEAGVEYVLGLVIRDGQILPAEDPYYEVAGTFAGGTFEAAADQDANGYFRVISEGVDASGVDRTVEVLFDIATTNRVLDDYGVFVCEDLSLTGSSTVNNGDVYTGGNLDIGNADAVSNGDVTARGNITFVTGKASVTGAATSETGTITAPEGSKNLQRVGGDATNPTGSTTLTDVQVGGQVISKSLEELDLNYCDETSEFYQEEVAVDLDEYKYDEDGNLMFDSADTHVGDVHVTSGTTNGYNFQHYVKRATEGVNVSALIEGTPPGTEFDGGVYYIEGDLTIKGEFAGSGTFVVEGNLIIEGQTTVGTDEDPSAFVVGGSVAMAGGSTVNGVIYTSGDIDASGGATVNGGVVALGSGGITGSLTVNVKEAGDIGLANPSIPNFIVQRWRLLN